jgi:hypothetical protein
VRVGCETRAVMRLLCRRQSENSKTGSRLAPRFAFAQNWFRCRASSSRTAFCATLTAFDCVALWPGDAWRGANSCCACGGAAHGASSQLSSRYRAWLARLAKQARPAASRPAIRSAKSFSQNVSPTRIPLQRRAYTKARKSLGRAHWGCAEKLTWQN